MRQVLVLFAAALAACSSPSGERALVCPERPPAQSVPLALASSPSSTSDTRDPRAPASAPAASAPAASALPSSSPARPAAPGEPCQAECLDVDACRRCLRDATRALEGRIDRALDALASGPGRARLRANERAWREQRDRGCAVEAEVGAGCIDGGFCGTIEADLAVGCAHGATAERLRTWERHLDAR